MRVATLATAAVVLAFTSASTDIECGAIRDPATCNQTASCIWPEPYWGSGGPVTTHREHCARLDGRDPAPRRVRTRDYARAVDFSCATAKHKRGCPGYGIRQPKPAGG